MDLGEGRADRPTTIGRLLVGHNNVIGETRRNGQKPIEDPFLVFYLRDPNNLAHVNSGKTAGNGAPARQGE